MRTAKEFRAFTVKAQRESRCGGMMSIIVLFKELARITGSERVAEKILFLVDANNAFKHTPRDRYLVVYLQSIELRMKLLEFRNCAATPLRDPHGLRKQLIAKRKKAQGVL